MGKNGNAKNMSYLYRTMSDVDLRTLRSKKILRGLTIAKSQGYFDMKEKEMLRSQIRMIDAELNCRRDQLPLEL